MGASIFLLAYSRCSRSPQVSSGVTQRQTCGTRLAHEPMEGLPKLHDGGELVPHIHHGRTDGLLAGPWSCYKYLTRILGSWAFYPMRKQGSVLNLSSNTQRNLKMKLTNTIPNVLTIALGTLAQNKSVSLNQSLDTLNLTEAEALARSLTWYHLDEEDDQELCGNTET